ncbi:MAG TPA: LptA/OstA family protein [bacterium]|nr:LptA/OstA family protein [bacterium]
MAPALKALALGSSLILLAACAGPRLAAHKGAGVKPVAAVPRPQPTPEPAYPQSRPVDEARPVKVRSRSLRYNRATQETVFYGGVTTTQDSTVILSKELRSRDQGRSARADGGVLMTDSVRRFSILTGEADYTDLLREAFLSEGVHLVSVDPYGNSITVTGQSGDFSAVSRSARVDGGVTVLRGPLRASAASAFVYDGGAQLRLQKDVRVAMGFNRLQGEEALFDDKNHSLDLEGDVRLRVIPSQLRSAAAAPWSLSPTAQEGQ